MNPSGFREIKTKDASGEAGGRNQLARLGVRAAAAFFDAPPLPPASPAPGLAI